MASAVNFPNQQPTVDSYFDSVAFHWRELYRESGLQPAIFSHRQCVALNWLAQAAPLNNAHILDVGCGAGPASVALATRGARVKAIDTVQRMVDLTRQSAEEAGVTESVQIALGDVHSLEFAENSFDAAVVIGVIYWLHSPTQALRELFRVLKPGGHLVVSADNVLRLTYVLDPANLARVLELRRAAGRMLRSLRLRKPASEITVNRYSLPQFDELISRFGFQKLRSVTVGFGPFSLFERKLIPDRIGLRLHRYMQHLAERDHPILAGGGNHYVVLAKKPL